MDGALEFDLKKLLKFVNGNIGLGSTDYCSKSIIKQDDEDKLKMKQIFNQKEPNEIIEAFKIKENRVLASTIGSILGDSLGAHLEFSKFNTKREVYSVGFDDLEEEDCTRCRPGQWTDDSSMALCIADSLIEKKKTYDGIDLRTRFLFWWHLGYNNGLGNRRSFGLGGNIAESFECFYKDSKKPEMKVKNGLNNGNGSVMRLGFIPISFLNDPVSGGEYARKQSFTTHDGEEAAECCRLLTHLVIKLINREEGADYKPIFEELGTEFKSKCVAVQLLAKSEKEDIKGYPPEFNRKEDDRNWNWKKKELYNYSETRLQLNSGYIGSYCMDCVAMALNITYNTRGHLKDVMTVCNFGGDCDSVGAVVGMISGAIHGLTEDLVYQYKKFISQWDNYTIAARAMKLMRD